MGPAAFPLFGKLYLIIIALRSCSKAAIKSTRPFLMTQALSFSEEFSIIIIHSVIAGANIAMFICNILVDKYSCAYSAYLTQELFYLFLTNPLCIASIIGYLSLDLRRILFLSGQGAALFSLFGTGNINAFIAEQFSEDNHKKYIVARDYISLVFSFLGILIIPQLVEGFNCFGMNSCHFIPWAMDWIVTLLNALLFLSGIKLFHKPPAKNNSIMVLIKLLKDGRKEMKNQTELKTSIASKLQKYMPPILYSKLFDQTTRTDAAKVWATWKFFLPLSCFWALISQCTTTWIFQANDLDGYLGFNVTADYQMNILPNQIWGIIPLFGLMFTPIMTVWSKAKFPVIIMTVSQISIALAFFAATYLEFCIGEHDKPKRSLVMAWAVPQNILASFSEVASHLAYRLFNIRTVPRSMQQVSRNLLILSRALGNILVVIVVLLQYFFEYPTRQMQFFFYPILLCLFIVVFTLMNSHLERLINK